MKSPTRTLRDPAVVSRNMAAIRSKDTKPEVAVRSALWRRGYRFRKHDKRFPGTPDITFPRERVAVFCDSDFWHGRDWDNLRLRLTTRPEYWLPKIERTIARDARNSAALAEMGWAVVRLWESDIKRELSVCVDQVTAAVDAARQERVRTSCKNS